MLNLNTLFFFTFIIIFLILILTVLIVFILIYILRTRAIRSIFFNITATVLAIIITAASISSLSYSGLKYLTYSEAISFAPNKFNINDTFVLNNGEQFLLIGSYQNSIEIGYYNLSSKHLIAKTSIPITYEKPSISSYTNDNNTFYIHAENSYLDDDKNLQIKNHILFKLDLKDFIVNEQVETLINGIDDFWFFKPSSDTNYAYYIYRNPIDDFMNLTKISSAQIEHYSVKLPDIDGFLKSKGDLFYNTSEAKYLFCPDANAFIIESLQCENTSHTTFIYNTYGNIQKWNPILQEYEIINDDFFLGKMNTTLYHSSNELIFITRENYSNDAFLVYLSETDSWQKNLGKNSEINGKSITYDNQILCYQNSKYLDEKFIYSVGCFNTQNQKNSFHLSIEELEDLIYIYLKEKR